MNTTEEAVPIANCKRCFYNADHLLFQACTHESSKYKKGQDTQYHTIQHMRTRGACGRSATFYKPK